MVHLFLAASASAAPAIFFAASRLNVLRSRNCAEAPPDASATVRNTRQTVLNHRAGMKRPPGEVVSRALRAWRLPSLRASHIGKPSGRERAGEESGRVMPRG